MLYSELILLNLLSLLEKIR